MITGGPGSGKTALINALGKSGFCVFPELARQMIQDGGKAPIRNLREKNNGLFFKEILRKRIQQHQATSGNTISFFDRGIPDSLAFLKFMGMENPPVLSKAIDKYRYNNTVFLLPPWEEIYENDLVRLESFAEAEILFNLVKEAYSESGYLIEELPIGSIEKRVLRIRNKLTALADY